ncbi:MAG: EAL domain-containing protein [Alishewanella agri]|nr:EAL domain-containing protein [Alishewanella agri]
MRFLSFPSKILLLTLVLMAILLLLVTSMSLQRLNDSFASQQQLKQQQVEQHFQQYQQLLSAQQQAWFESFAELTQLQQQQGFTTFAQQLQQQYDSFSLYLKIEDLWFFNDVSELAFASTAFPADLMEFVAQTRQQQRALERIYCQEHCSNVVSIPLADNEGRIGVLLASQTLADVVIALGQAMQSEIAIIRQQPGAVSLLSATAQLPELDLERLSKAAPTFGARQGEYFIYQFPLTEQTDLAYRLILLENISQYQKDNRHFQWQLIAFGSLCFLLFAWLTFWLTRRLSRRLLQVSKALPLLSENKFRLFRDALPVSSPLLTDEVDKLSAVSQTLSRTLEKLQDEIQTQTRELENMAMFDLLTGLANRNMLQYHLKKQIAALSDEGSWLGLLFLDLDQFKRVNDIRGHEQGDQLLIEAARRLRAALQKTDLICRFGGDEFVVVTEVSAPAELEALALRLIEVFRQPMRLEQEEYQLNVSIGISCTRNPALKTDDLVRQADLAMYQAKARGGSALHFYSQQMFDAFQNRLALEADLKQALLQGQFDLHLQPQIRFSDRRLTGLEALLRWQSPSRGMVPPDEFISVLEYAQLMIPVGYWVIEQSCQILANLQQQGFADLRLAINLSTAQLNDPELPAFLDKMLKLYPQAAGSLEFELTESLLATNIPDTIASMQQLKARGFRLAIDDFGTGYSSLSYLRQMPVDIIKIDKSFVFGMLDNQADFDIITSTIAMVRKLGLEVVAEGVETQAQAKTLQQHACDIGQGYLFSRPIPSNELVSRIQAGLDESGRWR